MKSWTDESLVGLSEDELLGLFDNCERLGTSEALSLLGRIELLILSRDKLSVGETGLRLNSPVGKVLVKVINSSDAIGNAIGATKRGLPALAGVEPLIVAKLGSSYTQRYEATVQAGYAVAKMMERLGHKRSGKKGPMPSGSVATTAELFLRKE
jgi:hypothetical protein